METKEFGIVLILICLFMFALASALVIFFLVYRANLFKTLNEKQIAAMRAAVEAEEKQKVKTANDLHDEIIHQLTATKQQAEKDEVDIKVIISLLNQTISGVRSIALNLVPRTLIDFGLISAIEQDAMLSNTDKSRKIDVENATPFTKDTPFSKNDEVIIYRLCLEVLNNIIKHTQYKYLLVSFGCSGNFFVIEFTHDGKGVTNKEIEVLSKTANGLGLKSINSRLMILRATINYTMDSRDSLVKIHIPF